MEYKRTFTYGSRGNFWGMLLIILGFFLLLDNLHIVSFDVWGIFWAVVVIYIGVRLFRKPRHLGQQNFTSSSSSATSSGASASYSDNDYLNDSIVGGEIDHYVQSKAFRGGNLSNVFGEISVDLSSAELADGTGTLSLNTVFGNIKIILPTGMEYALEANTVFGEVKINSDNRGGFFSHILYRSTGYDTATKRIELIASTVFGEVKIIARQ